VAFSRGSKKNFSKREKLVKFHFSLSKLIKQPFCKKCNRKMSNFKIQGGSRPTCPFLTPMKMMCLDELLKFGQPKYAHRRPNQALKFGKLSFRNALRFDKLGCSSIKNDCRAVRTTTCISGSTLTYCTVTNQHVAFCRAHSSILLQELLAESTGLDY